MVQDELTVLRTSVGRRTFGISGVGCEGKLIAVGGRTFEEPPELPRVERWIATTVSPDFNRLRKLAVIENQSCQP